MIFLSLRNNRKLSHSWIENARKSLFGAIIAGSMMLIIVGLQIHKTQTGATAVVLPFDIKYMTTFIATFALMPLTMFIILAMNKHEYGRMAYRFIFESLFMISCIVLSAFFYMHMLSILMIQVAILSASVISIIFAFILSRLTINYRASTMYGKLVVKPISFDTWVSSFLLLLYMFIGFALAAGNIIYFKFVAMDTKNYLVYQFLITVGAIIFLLLSIGIFSGSRSLGQSQEVLYYRYAQLMVLTLIFLIIGIGVYRAYVTVTSSREIVDSIFIGVNFVPAIILFIDLYINKKRLAKNRYYQGFTEFRLLIKILSAVMAVLINMIIATEIKFWAISGEAMLNIDTTIASLASILVIILVPFFAFWKKITKRSSRLITTLLFFIFGFILYKFYFYAASTSDNLSSTVFGIPVDTIYTMVTLLAVLGVTVLTMVLQAKNSKLAYDHYGHKNTDKLKAADDLAKVEAQEVLHE